MKRRVSLLLTILVGFLVIVTGLTNCDLDEILDKAEEATEALGLTESFDENSAFGQEIGTVNDDPDSVIYLAEDDYAAVLPVEQEDLIDTLLGWLKTIANYEKVDEAPKADIIGKCDVSIDILDNTYEYVVYFYEENSVEAEATKKIFKAACSAVGDWTDNSND